MILTDELFNRFCPTPESHTLAFVMARAAGVFGFAATRWNCSRTHQQLGRFSTASYFAFLVASLLLVRPGSPSSFLFLVAMHASA